MISQRLEGRFRSAFIILVAKKFLAGADGSAFLPPIGPYKPPIGLYLLIVTAVSHICRKYLVQVCKVEYSFTGRTHVHIVLTWYL